VSEQYDEATQDVDQEVAPVEEPQSEVLIEDEAIEVEASDEVDAGPTKASRLKTKLMTRTGPTR
jgi:hypothetical protein